MQSLGGVSCVQVAAVTAAWTSRGLLRCHDCAVWGERKKLQKQRCWLMAQLTSGGKKSLRLITFYMLGSVWYLFLPFWKALVKLFLFISFLFGVHITCVLMGKKVLFCNLWWHISTINWEAKNTEYLSLLQWGGTENQFSSLRSFTCTF